MGNQQDARAGLEWFAGLGAPNSLIDRAKELLSVVARGPSKPSVEKQEVLPAYGQGADDWDNIAKEIKVTTAFGELVYVKMQAHNVAPLINQLSEVMTSAELTSTTMRAAGQVMRDNLKPIAKYAADPKKVADEISANASDSAVDKAGTAGAIAIDARWAGPMRATLEAVRKMADGLLSQIRSKLASIEKEKEAKEAAARADMLQKAIDAAVGAAAAFATGGPIGLAASLWSSAEKALIPNPLKDQAKDLGKAAEKLEVDGLNALLSQLISVCGDIDAALDEVEKTKQEVSGEAVAQLKKAYKRYGDDSPKGAFNFDLLQTAMNATQSAVQSSGGARGYWAYLKAPLKELDKEFGEYTYMSGGYEYPIDGKQVGPSRVGGVSGSRADMVRNAKIKDRNAKTMAAIGSKLDAEISVATAAFNEASTLLPELMALSSVATAALSAAPGKHPKAS